jgi:hypothetical protein
MTCAIYGVYDWKERRRIREFFISSEILVYDDLLVVTWLLRAILPRYMAVNSISLRSKPVAGQLQFVT